MSLKWGIDRAAVRAAQQWWAALAWPGPRDFPKHSYFLFLGPAASQPPGHRAQFHYTPQPVLWLRARVGVGMRMGVSPQLVLRTHGHGPLASS